MASAFFDSLSGERLLKERLGVGELGGFGNFSRAELATVGALLKYVELTQIGGQAGGCARRVTRVRPIRSSSMARRGRAWRSCGPRPVPRDGSLLSAIDRTVTGAGARELAARLASPLRDPQQIAARLDAVAFLHERETLRDDLRQALKSAPDMARASSRLALMRGGPRDLAAIRDGLAVAKDCARLLGRAAGAIGLTNDLETHRDASGLCSRGACRAGWANALVETPPHLRRDGGFVCPGFRADLDEALQLRDDSRRIMTELEARYIGTTGVKSLRIRHNNILGFFIELTALNARPLMEAPHNSVFRHRQTMANAVRFTTGELEEIEGRIASAAERALGIEQEVFDELAGAIVKNAQAMASLAGALAELDVYASLAELAAVEAYVRPALDETTAFEIHGGRHPVVEQALQRAKSGPFVENDCILGKPEFAPKPTGFDESADGRIWLVTGPNMAGKSTFLRQNALIVVLAQMGSFVPAKSACIGIVDRLFSRVGASDDLARGRSTFMVEMVETAGILNQATERSLVILDEIGRGTATFDGLSIAWATIEYLHDAVRCRTLFATHYHELTALAGRLSEVANVTIDVKEWHDDIVFLHKVRHGAADRSYGIQVAKLAGLPRPVIDRASNVLRLLEKTDRKADGTALALDELPLFAAARPQSFAPAAGEPSALDRAIDALNPDELTPKAALETLYRLKALRCKGSKD